MCQFIFIPSVVILIFAAVRIVYFTSNLAGQFVCNSASIDRWNKKSAFFVSRIRHNGASTGLYV